MGRSSLLGLEHAALEPAGRDTEALGPGDNSDSGSDRVGLEDSNTDDPVERHPARRGVGMLDAGAKDIGVNRVFTTGRAKDGGSGRSHDDEDPDLAFIDGATAGDPVEDEDQPAEEEDDHRGLGAERDGIPQGVAAPHRMPTGPNPAPDSPVDPGLPGDGDDEDLPADGEPDTFEHRPGRGAAARRTKAWRRAER